MKFTISKRGLTRVMNDDINRMPRFAKLKQFFCRHQYELVIVTGQRSHIFPDPINTMDTTDITVYCPKCKKKFITESINPARL